MAVVPAKTKNDIVEGPLGPIVKNYQKALNLLDENIIDAIQVLINGLTDEDKYFRFNCACTLLKKVVPDRKIKEISGVGGMPIKIDVMDRREIILNIVNLLDEIDIDKIKERTENGNFRLFELDSGTETEAEIEMERETGTDKERVKSGQDQISEQSDKSPVFVEKSLRRRSRRTAR